MITKILVGLILTVSCFAKQELIDNPSETVTLRGIVIVADPSSIRHVNKRHVHGVEIDKGLAVPSDNALQKKLEPWIGQVDITRENLLAIKNDILGYYAQQKQNIVTVEIPEQDITSGVVTIVVMQVKVGTVKYTGNRWFSKERVAKKLHFHKGDGLNENRLLNDISWLNENPFHYTEAILSPGNYKGTTNLELVTKDRLPLRVYTGGDNTGIESTGTSRFYGGVTWGDAFCIDDFLSYQFTSNSSFNKFNSHSLNYTSYLPWQHIFMLSGGYARIDPDINDFESHGKEAQASFRYKIPFKPLYTNFQHQFYFGFDYKYVTSILFFVSEIAPQETTNSIVNVTQEMLGYMFEYKPSRHELTFRLELFGSPAKWLPHQTIEDYSALRVDAKPRYFYGTATFGEIYTFSTKDSIAGLLRVQGSANTLIPSEQFKLGGYNSVRGYEESVFISDNGVIVNLEVRTRPFTFFKKVKDELTLLAFMDYGWGHNYHSFDGIQKTATLWGIGPGARYTINPYVSFRVDYGFKLHHVHFDDHKLGMWHVGGTLSY